jgi:hypothetical protein
MQFLGDHHLADDAAARQAADADFATARWQSQHVLAGIIKLCAMPPHHPSHKKHQEG